MPPCLLFRYLLLDFCLHTLRDGNPLVYGGAISRVEGDPVASDLVDVVDSSGKFIAWGKSLLFTGAGRADLATSRALIGASCGAQQRAVYFLAV